MISYTYGNYGFIRNEKMGEQPLFIYDLGVEKRTEASYYFDNNNRQNYNGYLLQYTLKGSGVFKKNGISHIMQEGDGFISRIPENSSYFLTCTNWEFFYIHFDGAAAESFFNTICQHNDGRFHLPVSKNIIRLFFEVFENCRRNGALKLYESGEFMYRFLAGILRELEAPSDNLSDIVHDAISYMRKNFASLDGMGELADYCKVSEEHLCRCFKKETGQPPLKLLTKLRMEHALFLLLNTNDTIESIASACGFLNGNYFAKVFKKYMQCSPTEYRRRTG